MRIERQIAEPLSPPLQRTDSFSGLNAFDELAHSIDELDRSVEDLGHWNPAARQMLQKAPARPSQARPSNATFSSPPRQMGYLQATALRPEPAQAKRTYSAVVAGRAVPVDTAEIIKAHRLGLDSHGRVVASHVQSSANALIREFAPVTDVEASLRSLNAYLETYALRHPSCPMAQRGANGAASLIEQARAYVTSHGRYALLHKDNAHFYLAGHQGEPPGFHMRRMLAIVWQCATTWRDCAQSLPDARGRLMLQQAVVRALADFTLESSAPGEFRCTSGQLLLLMRALQGWFPQVRIDALAPCSPDALEPPSANEFMVLFCYNLEVSSRSVPFSRARLQAKAREAMAQVDDLYAHRPDRDKVRAQVAAQIADYYAMTYDDDRLWPTLA